MPVQVSRTRLQDFAEIVGERRDEAEPAAGLGDRDVARRAAGAIVDVVQREALGQARAHHRQRQVLVEPPFADVAERHHLDEGELHAAPMRPLDERRGTRPRSRP